MWWLARTARLVGMTKYALAARPHGSTQAPHDTPVPATPVLITVAEVKLGTATTQSTRVRWRWFDAWRRLRTAPREARTHPSRRDDYLEIAAMAREMHRL
jgi:hypothetical protein